MGKKVIIALYGDQNTGKSTTLKRLIRMLGGKENEDAPVIIKDYSVKDHKSKTIVVAPGGDDGEVVRKNVDFFKKEEADILVTATRARKKPKGQEAKCSIKALEDSEWDEEIRTKAVWIYKSYLTYDEREDTVLKESITKEQAKTIRNTINEEQAKTIKLVIDNIIEEWEKKPEGNSASSDLVSE